MIDFYSYAPEIFILALILVSITFGILNKGVTIIINAIGFSLLTIFLIFKGHSLYQNSLYSFNTINLILLSKIILCRSLDGASGFEVSKDSWRDN